MNESSSLESDDGAPEGAVDLVDGSDGRDPLVAVVGLVVGELLVALDEDVGNRAPDGAFVVVVGVPVLRGAAVGRVAGAPVGATADGAVDVDVTSGYPPNEADVVVVRTTARNAW
jgi:hypothetical protein